MFGWVSKLIWGGDASSSFELWKVDTRKGDSLLFPECTVELKDGSLVVKRHENEDIVYDADEQSSFTFPLNSVKKVESISLGLGNSHKLIGPDCKTIENLWSSIQSLGPAQAPLQKTTGDAYTAMVEDDGHVVIASETGSFYVLNAKRHMYELKASNVVCYLVSKETDEEDFLFKFYIYDGSELVQSLKLREDLMYWFNEKETSIIWYFDDNEIVSVVFDSADSFENFRESFDMCMTQVQAGIEWEKIESGDRLLSHPTADFDMQDTTRRRKSGISIQGSTRLPTTPSKSNKSYTGVEVARAGHMVLSLDDQLQVMPVHDAEFLPTVSPLKRKGQRSSEAVNPGPMTLMDCEETVVMVNKRDMGSICSYDIDNEKIVEEFSVDDDGIIQCHNIAPFSKEAATTNEKLLYAQSKKGIYLLDRRISQKGRVVQKGDRMQGKTYTSKVQFCSFATGKEGEVAVGSEDGTVRLYNDVSKVAKTQFLGLGSAIIGIDVSTDGKWVLATTQRKLLVYSTETPSGTGFAKRMGEHKTAPIQLTLSPEDIAEVGGVNFTPARFSVDKDGEHAIVTSTGAFLVSWNFRNVIKRKLNAYALERYTDAIVANRFVPYDSEKLVVVHQHAVDVLKCEYED
eukprot:Rmarinus@m.8270